MNLHAIANGAITAVNPNLTGTIKQSSGYTYVGDANVVGAIIGTTLTVAHVNSGALMVGSILDDTTDVIAPGTMVTGLGSGTGGIGTYTVNNPQTVTSETIVANGTGDRVPNLNTITNVPMQFQALRGRELEHIDSLNVQGTVRAVHLYGDFQGVDRPGVNGGDLLLAPTNLTDQPLDTWLVVWVMEAFEASGWCRVAVQLQMTTQSQ